MTDEIQARAAAAASFDERSAAAAAAALAAHSAAMRLEDGNPASTGVWHLLASLMDYCAKHGIDLDSTLEDAKAERLSPGGGPFGRRAAIPKPAEAPAPVGDGPSLFLVTGYDSGDGENMDAIISAADADEAALAYSTFFSDDPSDAIDGSVTLFQLPDKAPRGAVPWEAMARFSATILPTVPPSLGGPALRA